MHGSKTFYALLKEAAHTHDIKSHDYASNDNPSGNYHFAGVLANMFSHCSQDAGFIGRIGEKIYRLANLEKTGKTAKNESIEDTERDLVVLMGLWMADRRDRRAVNQPGDAAYQSAMDFGDSPDLTIHYDKGKKKEADPEISLPDQLLTLLDRMPNSMIEEVTRYILKKRQYDESMKMRMDEEPIRKQEKVDLLLHTARLDPRYTRAR